MIGVQRCLLSLGILCLGLSISTAEHKHGKYKGRVFHGIIREDAKDGDSVQLDQELIVTNKDTLTGDEICGYTVYKSRSEQPFKVVLQDRKTGGAKIVLSAGYTLNYERRRKYSFEIAAHDCITGRHTDREKVHIEVEDVNEYSPAFKNQSYIVQVTEGELKEMIIKLETLDADGSEDFSKVCHYHILTPGVPFQITPEGILKNTEPLDFSKKHNYILEVKAEDCGGRISEKIMVNVKVKEICKSGWKGVPGSMQYTPGINQKLIADNAMLNVCEEKCEVESVSAKIHLETSRIGKGCDRDTYSIESQRKLCGAASGSIDLLPNPSDVKTEDGAENDQIFYFDGKKNAIEISPTKFESRVKEHFTISTWMKHNENPESPEQKEHLLCNSDGEKMNRHHYSLFIHNCRLVLLFRQEPEEGVDLNIFKPAEWRWKIPQVCDGEWHHYSVSMDFPEGRLYVDGKRLVDTKDNPEIIDDWPLHNAKKIHFNKLVVGACWHGGEQRLSQYFTGYLAGMTILKGETENDRVIQCLNNCKEKLDFHAMSEMETGMSISLNSEMTEITINGHTKEAVEKLVRRVGYINSRVYPTPGDRSLVLETDITCKSGDKVDIEMLRTVVNVEQPEQPIITLSGTENIAKEEHDIVRGEKILKDLVIIARTKQEEEELMLKKDKNDVGDMQNTLYKAVDADKYSLDSCTIVVSPVMNRIEENLTTPDNLMAQLGLKKTETPDGLTISGADKIYHYQEVLRQIHYIHSKPESMNGKTFVLTCSELNGRYSSNDLTVKLVALHVNHEHAHVAQAAQSISKQDIYQPVKNLKVQQSGANEYVKDLGATGTGVGVVVIIVVCVGFLVFMIVLGVIRIRSAHNRTQEVRDVEEKQEMEWDNSALTITVNPMDQESGGMEIYDGDQELGGLRGDDSDSDDDDASSYHDELESSEEEAEKVKDRDLEWDDSTLTF